MNADTTNEDALLSAAWDDFCEQLKRAGRLPFHPGVPQCDLSRAEGFRTLAGNIIAARPFDAEEEAEEGPRIVITDIPARPNRSRRRRRR